MNFLSESRAAASQIEWSVVFSNQTLQVILVVAAAMAIYKIVSAGVKVTLNLIWGILAILFVKYVVPWPAIVAICAAVIEYVFQPFYLGRSWEWSLKGGLMTMVMLGILVLQNAFGLATLIYFFRNKEMDSMKAAVILASELTVGLFFAGCLT